jgi:uncharacterized repeat protein (TIGR01451 family)
MAFVRAASRRLSAARASAVGSNRDAMMLVLRFSLLFLFLSAARAQVAFDAATSASQELTTTSNTLTFAHTSTGTNLLLVVGVSMNITANTAATVSSVTYNGSSLTFEGAHNDSTAARRTEIWFLKAPTAGSHNVVVTVNTGGSVLFPNTIGTVAGAATFTGADQTTPIRSYASNDSNGTTGANAWVNVPSGPDDYVLDTLAINSNRTAASTSTQQVAEWATASTGGIRDVYGFGSVRAGSASVAMSETLSGNATWSVSAVSIQPVQAELSVSASGSSAQFPANLTYIVNVTNNGPDTATLLSLTDTLASGLTLVSAAPSGGTGGSCTGANCTWTSLASGSTASVTITATPSAPGGYTLSASVTASTPDFITADNSTTTVSYSEIDQCATSTNTAAGTIGGVINTYYPGTATATAGSTSITVGAATGAGNSIAVGDLLLIIQMQDAAINTSNSSQYGDGISGSGSTSLNNSGVYEYATASSAVTTAGGTLTVQAAGPGGGLLYTYTSAAASSTQGARSFQVIRVPNYASATLSTTSNLTATAWNGSTGGVLALNISGTLTLNGATVDVSGEGFRGAAPLFQSGSGTAANTDYRFPAPAAYNTTTLTEVAGAHGSKGEGIAGTPEWIESGGGVASTGQTYAEGYPLGSLARGAPGNAGAGGTDADPVSNDENTGGGGGANGGAGGQGGNSWNSNLALGGLGGSAFPGGISRVVMGGGGGAGTSNNNSNFQSSSGAPGGGIVMIRAATITGNVTINANGSAAYNSTPNDGGGGGGAGGSIIFLWGAVTGTTPAISLNATGGRGGDAWDAGAFNNANRHGPGGGGGGGVILYTGGSAGGTVTTTMTGGASGVTLNTPGVTYGASSGIDGSATSGVSIASSPGPHSAGTCVDLSITKSGSPSPVIVNNTLKYTITVTNNNATTNATAITVTDTIPSQVTYNSYSIAGGTGGTCSLNAGVLTCTFTQINAASSAIITVNTTASTAYSEAVNTAIVDSTIPDPKPANNTATVSVPIEGPTSVRLNSFTATKNGNEVLLSWSSGGELHNLGFNVYREAGGERTRLNPSLIAGSALMMRGALEQHGAKSYGWIDRSPAPGALYWLEDVDLNGTRIFHGPVSVQSLAATPQEAKRALTIDDWSRSTSSVDSEGLVTARIREAVVVPASSESRQQIGYQLAAQPAVKIYVDHEGWYRVTQAQLAAAGFSPNVPANSLHLFAEGVEQPIRVAGAGLTFGPGSAIEFYGTAIDTPYSGKRVYWLISNSTPGLRVATVSAGSAGQPEPSFIQTIELKPRTTYFAALLREDTDNFFGPLISPTPAALNFNLSDISAGEGSIEVALQGVIGNQRHDVSIMLNAAVIGEIQFDGQEPARSVFPVPAGVLRGGANTLTFTSELGANDLSLVNYVDLSFPQKFKAQSNYLRFTASEGQSVTIAGFTQPPSRLVDVTNPAQPTLVQFQTEVVNGGYVLSTTVPWSSPGIHTFLALSDSRLAVSAGLVFHQPSQLHAVQKGAQVVVLTHPRFKEQARPLAELHESQGKTVTLLTVDEIYDEFNFGERSPYAIKRFLHAAVGAWKDKPHYLLLAGDASVDPRNYLGFGYFDFVPTKIIITSELKTASDDWFSDFNDAGFATIATGRLPARTGVEMQTMVSKTIAYISGATGSWTNQAMLVADFDDPSISFSQESLLLETLLPSTMHVTDVFAGVLGASTARQDVISGIDNGQLLVNYNGHGSVEVWSGSDLFDDASASALTNAGKLPVFVMMNCLNGFFHDVYSESLATALMLSPNGGAVAVWASSGLTAADPQFHMNQAFLQTLFGVPSMTLGDAVLAAKSSTADPDVRRTFILFGDPILDLK